MKQIADGLSPLTAMASRSGDRTIYIAVQSGRVVAIRNGVVRKQPVLELDRPADLSKGQGLLGIAFSPHGAHLYVHFTGTDLTTTIDEYAVVRDDDGDVQADPATRRSLLMIPQPDDPFSHFGGQLTFGPDGLLYVALGDGGVSDTTGDTGPGHAPEGNGQSLDTLLGKILRIHPTPHGARPYEIPPDNPFAAGGGLPEICNWGLRNPWRFSFDARTGDLWIADVGMDHVEEVTRVPARRTCGANLGWPIREGDRANRPEGADRNDLLDPVTVMRHSQGACAVIGGFVYRGSALPELKGWYVFTDLCDGRLRAVPADARLPTRARRLGARVRASVAFGQDNARELYVLGCLGCAKDPSSDPGTNTIYRLRAK